MPTSRVPTLGRSVVTPKPNSRPATFFNGKSRSKPNGSILAFFKKAPSVSTVENINLDLDESLFIEDNDLPKAHGVLQTPTPPMDNNSVESSPESRRISEDEGMLRFNEELRPVKRQRVEGPPITSPSSVNQKANPAVRRGPFFEDSDDDDGGDTLARFGERCLPDVAKPQISPLIEPCKQAISGETMKSEVITSEPASLPTNESIKSKGKPDFEDIEDFIDDEFLEEGEEYIERKWMEEYGEMEPGLDDPGLNDFSETRLQDSEAEIAPVLQETTKPVCPICSMSFDGLTDQVRQSWSFFEGF